MRSRRLENLQTARVVGDGTLKSRIDRALLEDCRLSGQPIRATVQHGVVTLLGSVQSYRRKLAAQEIAAALGGCRGVVNHLEVTPAGNVPDEEVARCVRSTLEAHAGLTKEVIAVDVDRGRVTLVGHVGSVAERQLAEDVALSCRGVRSIRNVLVIDLAREIEDEALSRQIQESLDHTRGLTDYDVRVAVNGDTAVLSGTVPELWQKETAERVVRRFRILNLRNDITLSPPGG